MLKICFFRVCIFCFVFYLGLPIAVSLAAAQTGLFRVDSPINDEVESAIQRVLSSQDKAVPLPGLSELAPLLEYMTTAGGGRENQHPAKREEGLGVFWRGKIDAPFELTLRYLFNPNIAPELIHPASVRLGYWLPGSDMLSLRKPLWESLRSVQDEPLVLRGVEYEEITPDDFSGSYYTYPVKNLIMLLRYKNTPMLLKVNWQDGRSRQGMKGGFLGSYNDWNFVFTRDEGGTATGLGWLSTYMYASVALLLYYPLDDRHTACTMFKWLNAGWAGLNVVKRSHILSGADRNLAGMREVIRAQGGASVETLEEITRDSGYYDRQTLLVLLAAYCQELEKASRNDDIMKRSEFQALLAGGRYAAALNDEELRALFRSNALKRKLGKPVLGG